MAEPTNEDLREWGMKVCPIDALKAFARHGMPRWENATKQALVDWIIENYREDFSESYRIEKEALAFPKHNHSTRGLRPEGMCPACDTYHQKSPAKEPSSVM